MSNLFLGLISGTSADGIDAALVDFQHEKLKLVASYYHRFSSEMKHLILSLYQPGADEINRLAELDILLGKEFAKTANTLLQKHQIPFEKIQAIGSHGQTIRHYPDRQYTLQIGDPNVIAAETGITTIADFRRRDMALGGQGAPLVPAFHRTILQSASTNRAIVNIGGIGNITVLPADNQQTITGFDTGPGNALLDAWITAHTGQPHDECGTWAKAGVVNQALLNSLLTDDYFKRLPPKSTGREYFHLDWLKTYLPNHLSPVDVQATLVELTAESIVRAIQPFFTHGEILVCGGGVHNYYLMERLQALATSFKVHSTEAYGIDPDLVEAIAFAWLAKQTLEKKPGNIIAVTGAKQETILGGIYYT